MTTAPDPVAETRFAVRLTHGVVALGTLPAVITGLALRVHALRAEGLFGTSVAEALSAAHGAQVESLLGAWTVALAAQAVLRDRLVAHRAVRWLGVGLAALTSLVGLAAAVGSVWIGATQLSPAGWETDGPLLIDLRGALGAAAGTVSCALAALGVSVWVAGGARRDAVTGLGVLVALAWVARGYAWATQPYPPDPSTCLGVVGLFALASALEAPARGVWRIVAQIGIGLAGLAYAAWWFAGFRVSWWAAFGAVSLEGLGALVLIATAIAWVARSGAEEAWPTRVTTLAAVIAYAEQRWLYAFSAVGSADVATSDTTAEVAAVHLALGVVVLALARNSVWLATGGARGGRLAALGGLTLTFLGLHAVAWGFFALGAEGMPRRYARYLETFETLERGVSAGAFVAALGALVLLGVGIHTALRRRAR